MAFTGVAWPANNLAVYAPISVPSRFTVARFMVCNAGTLTGTVDVGLYSESGSLLASTGNTARAGASAVQYIGIADQSFPPGKYYLALVATSTSGTYSSIGLNNQYEARFSGWLQEALGGGTLPATMTPVPYAQTSIFHFGFTQSDTL